MTETIRTIGNWRVGIYKGRISITDDWHSDWPIFYNETQFALDNPCRLPKSVLDYVRSNCKKLHKIQNALL